MNQFSFEQDIIDSRSTANKSWIGTLIFQVLDTTIVLSPGKIMVLESNTWRRHIKQVLN